MEGRQRAVVYFRGTGKQGNHWYRVYVDDHAYGNNNFEGIRKNIKPVAGCASCGSNVDANGNHLTIGVEDGSWTVVSSDNDHDMIYWVAGTSFHFMLKKYLLRQSAESSYPRDWYIESQRRVLPRGLPFIASVGRKLYLVGGTEDYSPRFNVDWSNGCGEIYDLGTKTFEYMNNVADLNNYDTRQAALVVKGDGTKPTGIVFYCFVNGGSMLFLDLANADQPSSHTSHGHYSFASLGPGLEDSNIDMLHHVTRNIRAVFMKDTLYWFGYDMRLYGYDVNRRIWLRSTSLAPNLGMLTACLDACHISIPKPSMCSSQHRPNCPLLVGLPNGKFVVIVSLVPGELTIASLVVVKDDQSLTVSVEHIQAYSLDDTSFVPSDAMAF